MTREGIRYSLQRKLSELVGAAEGAELMAVSPPVAWSELATKSDIATLRGELLERIGALEGQVGALDGKMSAQAWKMYGASFASSVMTAGLVLGAVQAGMGGDRPWWCRRSTTPHRPPATSTWPCTGPGPWWSSTSSSSPAPSCPPRRRRPERQPDWSGGRITLMVAMGCLLQGVIEDLA